MLLQNIISDSPKLTDYEFFRRELGLNILHLEPSDSKLKEFEYQEYFIIASTRPQIWTKFLKTLPKSTVLFFLLGNETYNPAIFNSLNDLKSIKHAFVYNPPTKVKKINHWYSLIGDLIDQFPNYDWREIKGILRDNRTSRHLETKFVHTELRYSWSRLPQGYSNSFVSGLVALEKIPRNQLLSLIDSPFPSQLQLNSSKTRKYVFVGQETNRRREQVISLLKRRRDAIYITKSTGFGGTSYDGDSSYVSLLLNSWFNVIPPGYFNNFNHRYTESCIAGSIPVILYQNSIDHSDNSNWTRSLSALQSHSFKCLSRKLDSLSENELWSLALQIRTMDFQHIYNTRKTILEILGQTS
jgi:hypothetical protein